jgi:hypothetical protein
MQADLKEKILELKNRLLQFLLVLGGEKSALDFPEEITWQKTKKNPQFLQLRQQLADLLRNAYINRIKSLEINELIVQYILWQKLFPETKPIAYPVLRLFNSLLESLGSKSFLETFFKPYQLDLLEFSQNITNNSQNSNPPKTLQDAVKQVFPSFKSASYPYLPSALHQWVIQHWHSKASINNCLILQAETGLLPHILKENQAIDLTSASFWVYLNLMKEIPQNADYQVLISDWDSLFKPEDVQINLFALPDANTQLKQHINRKTYDLIFANALINKNLPQFLDFVLPRLNFGAQLILGITKDYFVQIESYLIDNQGFNWSGKFYFLEVNACDVYLVIIEKTNIRTNELYYAPLDLSCKDWTAIPFRVIKKEVNEDLKSDIWDKSLPLINDEVKFGRGKKAIFKWFDNLNKTKKLAEANLLSWENSEKPVANKYLYIADYQVDTEFWSLVSLAETNEKYLQKALAIPYWRLENQHWVENISDWGLQQFKKQYETEWQNEAQSRKYYLKQWFDVSEFEQCQVEESLAFDIRKWISLIDNYQEINYLQKNINHPDEKTIQLFQKYAKGFQSVKKAFERLGNKATKNSESKGILNNYFEIGEEGLVFLQSIENQLDTEDLEREIQKEDIFYYCLAVLQSDDYQHSNKHLLKNSLPKIPFLANFWQWVQWGKNLFEVYTQGRFEKILQFQIQNIQLENEEKEKFILKAEPENALIRISNCLIISNLSQELIGFKIGHQNPLEAYLIKQKNEIKTLQLNESETQKLKKKIVNEIRNILSQNQQIIMIRNQMKH